MLLLVLLLVSGKLNELNGWMDEEKGNVVVVEEKFYAILRFNGFCGYRF